MQYQGRLAELQAGLAQARIHSALAVMLAIACAVKANALAIARMAGVPVSG